MKDEIIYWTTRDGSKIDVDKMSTDHLRKVLKMIIRQNPPQVKTKTDNIMDCFWEEKIRVMEEDESEY